MDSSAAARMNPRLFAQRATKLVLLLLELLPRLLFALPLTRLVLGMEDQRGCVRFNLHNPQAVFTHQHLMLHIGKHVSNKL